MNISITNSSTNPTHIKKNPAAVALGRLGGLKGGKARAVKLSSLRRKAIARKAAKSRWKNKK
ncbi:MAG: RNA-binding protein [Bacteroidetes bacterium]|nr:RNA-binding protein [Bacteroidota bacterium]